MRFTRCSLFVWLKISVLHFFSSAQQTPSQPQMTLSGQHDRTPVTTKHEKRLYANPLLLRLFSREAISLIEGVLRSR
jgi:hypothetical protein